MHRKSREVCSVFLVVLVAFALLWVAEPVCLGSTPPPGAVKTVEAGSNRRKASLPKKVAVSPFDRIFAPGLDKYRTGAAQRSDKRALKIYSAPSVSRAPNFGGFVSAPLYSSQVRTACITDPYNCGVNIFASGDFNRDGKPDLAIFQYDGTLNVLLNDGTGGLLPPVAYGAATAVANNYGIGSVQVADVNGDGYPDLLALDTNNNQFLVFLNQKNGTFAPPLAVLSLANGSVGAMANGDVNHDGNIDVVVVSYSAISSTESEATVQTFLGNGDGTFAAPTPALTTVSEIPIPFTLIEPAGLALADVNNDGSLDLITILDEYTQLQFFQAQLQLAVSVTLGNNTGAFAGFSNSVPIVVEGPFSALGCCLNYVNGLYPVDLNNDGNLDLVVDAGYNVLSLLGKGNGTFQNPVETAPDIIPASPETLQFADVTGDGYLDLIDDSDFISVSPGNGDGTFGPAISNYATGALRMAAVDMNGDGILDLIGLEGEYRSVSVFYGRGDGTYTGAPLLTSPVTGSNPETLTLELAADVTGLGNTDLVEVYQLEAGQGAQLLTALSDGKGNFNYVAAFPAAESQGFFSNNTLIQPVSADFNGDGKQDIILSGPHGALSVALSNGDGTFQTPVAISLGALDCPVTYAAVGDLQNSGKQSIVVPYPGDAACGGPDGGQSGYFVIPGNGDGTFGAPQFQPFGNELYSAVLANINGSGVLGLVLDDSPFDSGADFGVYYLPGNGDGTFGSPATVSSSYMVSQVIAGDYNQDGAVDLIMFSAGEQHPAAGQPIYATAGILLYPGNGDGTFGAVTQLGTGTFYLNGAFADVNGDGLPDIAAAAYEYSDLIPGPVASFGLSTFLGTGGGNFSAPVNFLAPDFGVESVFAGNFLSDNAPDIVLQTPSGTELLLNQGGTVLSLGASAPTITQGGSVILTATLQPTLTNRPDPTGTINFLDNGISLGLVPLNGGTASVAVATLGAGPNQISASYSGDPNFNPNAHVAAVNVSVTALPPAITLTSNPTAVTLSSGNIATSLLNIAANATFSGNVTLSVANLPANVHAVVAPPTVTLSGGQATTATLVLTGTQTSAAADRKPYGWASFEVSGLLAFLFLTGPARRKRRRSSLVWPSVCLLLLTGATLGSVGCGNSNSSSGKPMSMYNLQVTATPANSSVSPQTLYFTLTVQN